MKIIEMFLRYTWDSLKAYFRGLLPRTRVVTFTNPCCQKMINISREWMGVEIKENVSYELNEIDVQRLCLEKENLPRIQKIIQKYEEEHGEIIADKTVKNRI